MSSEKRPGPRDHVVFMHSPLRAPTLAADSKESVWKTSFGPLTPLILDPGQPKGTHRTPGNEKDAATDSDISHVSWFPDHVDSSPASVFSPRESNTRVSYESVKFDDLGFFQIF